MAQCPWPPRCAPRVCGTRLTLPISTATTGGTGAGSRLSTLLHRFGCGSRGSRRLPTCGSTATTSCIRRTCSSRTTWTTPTRRGSERARPALFGAGSPVGADKAPAPEMANRSRRTPEPALVPDITPRAHTGMVPANCSGRAVETDLPGSERDRNRTRRRQRSARGRHRRSPRRPPRPSSSGAAGDRAWQAALPGPSLPATGAPR